MRSAKKTNDTNDNNDDNEKEKITMAEKAKKSWAQQGFGGTKAEEERLATLYGPNRVWLKPGSSCDFLFIDDEPFCFYEHNAKIDGSWKNWVTCLSGSEHSEVPCCEILGPNSKYYVGYFTVVDLSKWTDKKGNVHQYEVKLLPCKLRTMKKFERKKNERSGKLAGCIFRAHREDEDSPNVGDEFEFLKVAEMDKVFDVANYKGTKLTELYTKAAETPEALNLLGKTFTLQLGDDKKPLNKVVPFNYFSIFEPKDPRVVRTMLAGATNDRDEKDAKPGTGTNAAESGAGADDIPF